MNSQEKDEPLEQGWEKRFVTDLSRVEEWVQLYEEMDFEVKAVPYVPVPGECDECVMGDPVNTMVIYTRKTPDRSPRKRNGGGLT